MRQIFHPQLRIRQRLLKNAHRATARHKWCGRALHAASGQSSAACATADKAPDIQPLATQHQRIGSPRCTVGRGKIPWWPASHSTFQLTATSVGSKSWLGIDDDVRGSTLLFAQKNRNFTLPQPAGTITHLIARLQQARDCGDWRAVPPALANEVAAGRQSAFQARIDKPIPAGAITPDRIAATGHLAPRRLRQYNNCRGEYSIWLLYAPTAQPPFTQVCSQQIRKTRRSGWNGCHNCAPTGRNLANSWLPTTVRACRGPPARQSARCARSGRWRQTGRNQSGNPAC